MLEEFRNRILEAVADQRDQPKTPRRLARAMEVSEEHYPTYRNALRELMASGQVITSHGSVVLPTPTNGQKPAEKAPPKPAHKINHKPASDEFEGVYRHNKRGFGFVVPRDPAANEDLFIPEGQNQGAMTGDVVRAKITERNRRDGKIVTAGRITLIIERTNKRFVGTLVKQGNDWFVHPDGNNLTTPISTPDAATRHVKPGAKVVVELTSFPDAPNGPAGVITEVLGKDGEKDVDLRSVLIQFNLPQEFPDAVREQARHAVDTFSPDNQAVHREDLSAEVVCTVDPDDAKDYDDAISLKKNKKGQWELGVHIADVSHFVPEGSPLDLEAKIRGNSCYFPGHVVPMLPEILSNGVCSLQADVGRLCKSAFITFDDEARPIQTRFSNTLIRSAQRLRYREAQAIIDHADSIPHPDGPRKISDYPAKVVTLLHDMNALAKRIQTRRLHDGQIVLDLPEIDLVLDENGRVSGAIEEDHSFTHILIEMFMVEANEAVARLLDFLDVPFLRRTHPGPENDGTEKLRHFVQVAGYKIPKDLDRKAIQSLLAAVKGRPEGFAINLAVLRSLSRAEYSPKIIGHYALASEHYCHFTSPIRRYADLTIHRLLDAYFIARAEYHTHGKHHGKVKPKLENIPTFDDLTQLGRQLSLTERRADEAERELRQIKILEILKNEIGQVFDGVVTGITNFGIFIQIQKYLVDGLIRYENLMDDWWDVDERAGIVKGQRTGKKIGIGDLVKVIVVKVDVPRRELDLSITQLLASRGKPDPTLIQSGNNNKRGARTQSRGGQSRNARPSPRSNGRPNPKPYQHKNKGPKKGRRR